MISIVVTTYNEERIKDMLEMLDSLQHQKSRNFEIIIVVEKSKKLFSSLRDYLSHTDVRYLVVFSEGLRGISYSRNLGVRHSRGDIIAFTDDDAILSEDWIENLAKAYAKHPEAIGITGQALPLWIDGSQSWFPKELYWMVGCTAWRGWNEEQTTTVVSGVNMSFRSQAFSVVCFREDMGAGASTKGKLWFPNEDNDYAMELSTKTNRPIIFDPKVQLFHKIYPFRLKPKYIRKYAFWQGCAEAQYSDASYSKGKRQSLRLKVFTGLLSEVFRSALSGSEKQVGARKLRVLLLTFSFFAVGYVAYVFGIYKYIYRYF